MIILETQRLILRHFEPGDLDDLYALYRDPDTIQYIPDAPRTEDEARQELEWHMNGHPRRPELGLWAVIEKSTGRFIGRCGLLPWTIDGQDEVEVAYLIARTDWGQGFGTEAARAVAEYAFDHLGLHRLVCLIDAENRASIAVATKIGMAYEKDSRDEIGPFQLYSMNRQAGDSPEKDPD